MILGWLLIGRPARELVTKTHRMAAGDLAPDLIVTRADELGQLAMAVNELCLRLNEAGVRLGEEEEKRLSAEAEALRAAAERDDAVAQLLHADRLSTIGRLAASLAHELGSPLTVIAGRAQSIARGRTQGEAKVQQSAQIVADQAKRVGDLIQQLLDYSRRQPSERQQINLPVLITHWAEVLQPLGKRHGVEVVVHDERETEGGVLAFGDPGLIQQVVANLVVNGIHAQPDGGRVHIRVAREGDDAVLEVTDEGEGIPPEVREHIFEPFFTTKKAGEGTGLGLSVVQEIVVSHGGAIEVETPKGGGTTFRVRLPSAKAGGQEEAA
jgi:two-component system NtrC family sensor kinase